MIPPELTVPLALSVAGVSLYVLNGTFGWPAMPFSPEAYRRILAYRVDSLSSHYLYGDPSQPLIISTSCLNDEKSWARIESCCSLARRLALYHLTDKEISRDTVLVYWLSHWDGEVCNGGHLQVAENIGWDPRAYATVRAALKAVGAFEYLEIFKRAEAALVWAGPAGMYRRKQNDDVPFDEQRMNMLVEPLGMLDNAWFALHRGRYNLEAMMNQWILSRPNLRTLSIEEMLAYANQRRDSLPDLQERRRAAIERTTTETKVTCAFADWLGFPCNPIQSLEFNFQFENKYRALRVMINGLVYFVVLTETESILLAEDRARIVFRLPTEELLQRFPYQGHERYLWQGDATTNPDET